MTSKTNSNSKENILYNNILSLVRNKELYTRFDLRDTFQNRINLIFLHVSFLFIKVKHNKNIKIYDLFYQKMFDLIFKKIEIDMREIGYGDTTVNKNMKFLIRTFYNILLNCENYKRKSNKLKNTFLDNCLSVNSIITSEKAVFIDSLIDYFNKYEAFCFDLSSDSVLQGDLKFNYK